MALDKFSVPTPSEIRDNMLRVERNGLIARGVTNPNLTENSDYFVRAESLSQQLSIGYANTTIKADQQMPDSAVDTTDSQDLTRILAIFGLEKRAAQASAGNIVLTSSASTFVAVGAQLQDGAGNVFEVSVGGTYANGASIPVEGVSAGKSTNHAAGDVLQWFVTPAYSDPKALVGIGGLTGGADADDDETARNRLFTYFRNPPAGGNWSQVSQWASEASASVQAAYVYPALNGPATVGVCVLGSLSYDSTLGWTRGIPSAILTAVANYVAARLPEHINLTCQSPIDAASGSPDVDVDVAIGLSLPSSVSAGGPGGGWTDATPWPALNGTATKVTVSAVTSSTQLTLTSDDAGTTPSTVGLSANSTKIAWFSSALYFQLLLDPTASIDPVVVATVTAVSGTTGALVVTIDKPFTGIAVGDFVMPNAEKIQAYAKAFMTAMNQLGPGQWAETAIVPRRQRRPLVAASNPSDLTSFVLRAMSDSGEEVEDTAYLYRSLTTPGLPSDTTTVSPNVLVPRRFGFYNKIV